MNFAWVQNAVPSWLAPKRFGYVSYVCAFLHIAAGVGIAGATAALREHEAEKFSCFFRDETTKAYKIQVERSCFLKYDKIYNSPLPLYQFVSLSFGFTAAISFVYLLIISRRVDKINSIFEKITDDKDDDEEQNWKTVYVFYFYFVHLVLRSILGIVLTVLQHAYFYPNGYESKFNCILSSAGVNAQKIKSQSHFIQCENSTSYEKWIWGILVSVINITSSLVLIGEIVYLCRARRASKFAIYDFEFVIVYFFLENYERPLTSDECIVAYKEEVVNREVGGLYSNVTIQTERAPYRFPKDMDRQAVNETYMKVPATSIPLENIKDLFLPNEDTKGKVPLKILAIGRPGIGKTSLTEKIIADWAGESDEYYRDKIAFRYQFRDFNDQSWQELQLKRFLQLGTTVQKRRDFKSVFNTLEEQPSKALFIFDGLDEYNDAVSCFRESKKMRYEPNTSMPAMVYFFNLVLGHIFNEATVLVTSRPTAARFFYSETRFDREVEIIGMTEDQIEDYVTKRCNENGKSALEPVILAHIKSSSDLLNLCRIPVNCDIVCTALFQQDLSVSAPTTLTALYTETVGNLKDEHSRGVGVKPLEKFAFLRMDEGQLVFNKEMVDKQMEASGLINKISHHDLQPKYCFLHLTIQEFLAARHVTETFEPLEIESFISENIGNGKWHLVLQFIAGLLGEKMMTPGKNFKSCFRAYAKHLEVVNGEIELNYNHVMVMKCLREVDDERTVEDVCDTTILKEVKKIHNNGIILNDWEAVAFVCRFMKNLEILDLDAMSENGLQEVLKLLEKRCINELALQQQQRWSKGYRCKTEQVFDALTNMECKLIHKCANLTSLKLACFLNDDGGYSNTCAFFKDGHARHLEKLCLIRTEITSSHSVKLLEALCSKNCPKLAELCFEINRIGDKGALVLFNTL